MDCQCMNIRDLNGKRKKKKKEDTVARIFSFVYIKKIHLYIPKGCPLVV